MKKFKLQKRNIKIKLPENARPDKNEKTLKTLRKKHGGW